MAATDDAALCGVIPAPDNGIRGQAPAGLAFDAAAALMRAALALPILAVPAKAGAAEVGEVGFALLGYKERGLMKVSEPVLWGRVEFAEVWDRTWRDEAARHAHLVRPLGAPDAEKEKELIHPDGPGVAR